MLAIVCACSLTVAAYLPSFYKFLSVFVLITGGYFINKYNQKYKI